MSSFFSSIGNFISDTLGKAFSSIMNIILYNVVYKVLYYAAAGICWLLNLIYSVFEVFAGITQVKFNGQSDYLINIFFSNTAVSGAYWGMALIAIVLCFAFALVSVGKKMFDVEQRQQHSLGMILGNVFKSIVMIISFTAVMAMVLNATNLLLQKVNDLMTSPTEYAQEQSITFTDEQFATMARVLNTVGNYSLNPSYNSRINVNRCFNDCRGDLKVLYNEGVFNFSYPTSSGTGQSWQAVLEQMANSASLDEDLKLDVYNESVSNSVQNAMKVMNNDASFAPLKSYTRPYNIQTNVPLDRVMFLSATMHAAKNAAANAHPSMTDAVRGPYYTGQKSIYNIDDVSQDFDIGIGAFDYLIIFVFVSLSAYTLAGIIFNCGARIFNMVLLYIIAPMTFSTMPLDDGGKYKQWLTAFIIQCLGIFGTVISMRLLLIFLQIIFDSKLQLFDNIFLDLFARVMLMISGMLAVKKANAMITGILADQAGYQSILAGDISNDFRAMRQESHAKADRKRSEESWKQGQKDRKEAQRRSGLESRYGQIPAKAVGAAMAGRGGALPGKSAGPAAAAGPAAGLPKSTGARPGGGSPDKGDMYKRLFGVDRPPVRAGGANPGPKPVSGSGILPNSADGAVPAGDPGSGPRPASGGGNLPGSSGGVRSGSGANPGGGRSGSGANPIGAKAGPGANPIGGAAPGGGGLPNNAGGAVPGANPGGGSVPNNAGQPGGGQGPRNLSGDDMNRLFGVGGGGQPGGRNPKNISDDAVNRVFGQGSGGGQNRNPGNPRPPKKVPPVIKK